MIVHILKKDLKRKRTMNIILFLFIVLATMFVASGINNVVTVMKGTDYFFEKAGIEDYVVLTMGEHAVGALNDMLETEPAIKQYRMEQVVYGSQDNITMMDGSPVECKNTTLYQSLATSVLTFFDSDNVPITKIEPGHMYVTGNFMKENGFRPGEQVRLEHNGVSMTLILDGFAKDALFGSDFMGNIRFLLNQEDMQQLQNNEIIRDKYRGEICYIETDDTQAVKAALSDVTNVAFDGARSLIEMCYVMDMVIAILMVILSICLIIVSFAVLKFSITFTISEEFREIGVMKAIGITNLKIRSLYLTKYLIIAICGAIVGFFISIPFSEMLLDSVSEKMVLGNENAIGINILGSVLVVCVVLGFAFYCTGKVKAFSPIDAIRSGQTGERFKKKSIIKLQKFPGGNSLFMAVNDIMSSPRRFLTIIISFGLCMLFVLMLTNTVNTMNSPRLIYTFGTKSHLYVTDVNDVMEQMGSSIEGMKKRLEEQAKELTAEGMPAELCIELQFKYPVTFKGNKFHLSLQQGVNTNCNDYKYLEGTAPGNEKEIAVTPQIAEILGAGIGDTVTIQYAEQEMECIITATFQTMNLMGEVIRIHENAPTDMEHIASALAYQINFTDSPAEEEIERRKEKIKKLYRNDKVMNVTEYCIDCTAVSGTLESVQYLLLGITLVVVILVTILMEKNFIAEEKSQIAILKAIGFQEHAIIRWHVWRFGVVSLIAIVIAAGLSIPMTELCITPIFGMMGAVDVDFHINVLQVFFLYPGLVLAVTVLITWITALGTRKIQSNDTANIE